MAYGSRRIVLASLAILTTVVALLCHWHADPRAVLHVSGDTAPVRVEIVGTSHFLDRIENCRTSDGFGYWGRGSNRQDVDWDDGSDNFIDLKEGSNCSERQRTHLYNVPGKYVIKLNAWEEGTDSCAHCKRVIHTALAEIEVRGIPPEDALEIGEITPKMSGESLYGAIVKFNASVSARSQIRLEAVDDTGNVLAHQEILWSRVGRAKAWFHMGLAGYINAISIRVKIIRSDKVIYEAMSGIIEVR